MRRLLTLGLLGACAVDDPPLEISDGDVHIIADGSANVVADACLGQELSIFCSQDGFDELDLSHDGVVTPMPFGGLLFPSHNATVPLGDPTTVYEIRPPRPPYSIAQIWLPPAFDFDDYPPGTLTASDTLHLSWYAGVFPMRWQVDFQCASTIGYTLGEGFHDAGSLDVAMSKVLTAVEEVEQHPEPGPCEIAIVVDRVRAGKLLGGFDADLPAGIQRRVAAFTLTR